MIFCCFKLREVTVYTSDYKCSFARVEKESSVSRGLGKGQDMRAWLQPHPCLTCGLSQAHSPTAWPSVSRDRSEGVRGPYTVVCGAPGTLNVGEGRGKNRLYTQTFHLPPSSILSS